MWRRFLACLALLGLGACSALPATPSAGRAATLVVYQSPQSYAQAQGPLIYVNGMARGRLVLGRELSLPVPAGTVRVSAREPLLFWAGREVAATELSVGVGQTAYARLTGQRLGVEASGVVRTQAILEGVDATVGEARR